MRYWFWAVIPFLLAASAVFGGNREQEFCLVRNGVPACTIVVAENPTPAARLAALELQYHVLKITGAELPIRGDHEQIDGPRILVGDTRTTATMGLQGSAFLPQEYLIAFRPDTLILLGRDWQDTPENRAEFGRPMCCGNTLADTRQRIDYRKTVGMPERGPCEIELPGIYDDQGTCYAAYHFMEQFLGVRWYGASAISVIIPARSTLIVKGADIRRSPALKYRDALWSGMWPFMRGQWGEVSQPEIWLFWRRLRLGGEKWAGNHTFHQKTIQNVLNDPEYQAQGPGKGTQLCYTHPKLVETVSQMARDFFDGRQNAPEGWEAVGNYFAVAPDDNNRFCECSACQALLAAGRDRRTGMFSSGTVSEYFYSFVNAVAREVRKTHPDKYIATLAYWDYAYPPRNFTIEPNVSVAPCLHTCMYAIHREIRQNDMALYYQWLKQAKAPVYLWNYYHHPMEAALIGNFTCFPNVMVHTTADTMRMFIRDGIRGIFVCGEQDMLEAYIIAKIWDNPDLDIDVALDEFFRLYFGRAEKPMKKFYLELERIATNPKNYPHPVYRRSGVDWKAAAWEHLGTESRMKRLGKWITEAQAVATTAEEKQRVDLWTNALWRYMVQGREKYFAEKSRKSEKTRVTSQP